MYTPGDVYILWVHEIPFVKSAYFAQRLHPEQHEAPLMVGDICHLGVITLCQHIPPVAPSHHFSRQKSPAKHVIRRRQQPLCILLCPVGRYYSWRNLSYLAVAFKLFHKPGYHAWLKGDVGIHRQMRLKSFCFSLSYCAIVGRAISRIIPPMYITQAPLRKLRLRPHYAMYVGRFGRIIHHPYVIYSVAQ